VQHHRRAVEVGKDRGQLLGRQRSQLELVADLPADGGGECLEYDVERVVG